jgi:acyl-CoA synthetase (AMP-forming)/AMP-acid ligase II
MRNLVDMGKGQTYYCHNAARLGAKVFIMRAFDVQKYLLYMDIYRITFMASVPTIMATLAKQANAHQYNLHSVEQVTSGSAPLSADLGKIIQKMYLRPEILVKQGWGMTEATCSISGFSPDEEDVGCSIGYLNPNCAAHIEPVLDRDFTGVAPEGIPVGEICVSGPNVMKGYYKKPTATEETIVYADGHRWLRTGDLGYADADGRLYIVDRLKELIKVKGLQVAPAELEQFL